jgi:hypothetical protein
VIHALGMLHARLSESVKIHSDLLKIPCVTAYFQLVIIIIIIIMGLHYVGMGLCRYYYYYGAT